MDPFQMCGSVYRLPDRRRQKRGLQWKRKRIKREKKKPKKMAEILTTAEGRLGKQYSIK